jgi:hypothetical protein
MWFGLAKMALKTGAEVYKNRQESKILNSLAERKHLEKVVAGEIEYKNTVLQSHKNDLKDEFVLILCKTVFLYSISPATTFSKCFLSASEFNILLSCLFL